MEGYTHSHGYIHKNNPPAPPRVNHQRKARNLFMMGPYQCISFSVHGLLRPTSVIQAILGPMSFKQVNGLSRSETVVTFLSRCFTFFHAMCRPTWQFIKLLSHSYRSIGNLIPSVHWLPRQEGGVHYSHDRFHTLHVHVMWLIQTGWDETSRF